MNARAIANHCMKLSFYDLQNFAGKHYQNVYDYIKTYHPTTSARDILVGTIFTCVASDGTLSGKEADFVASFIGGYSYDDSLDTAGAFLSEDARNVVRDLAKKFPSEIRESYVSMCIAVLAVDKRLDGEEIDFINSLL